MRRASWVLAYHGCDREVGEAILAGRREIRVSSNDHDWLGGGAYFWENSHERAMGWAKRMARGKGSGRNQVKVPFALGAIIDPGNCLDLGEAGCLDILKAAYDETLAMFEKAGQSLPGNQQGFRGDQDFVKRKLDCLVINSLHEFRRQQGEAAFDTVRCPFREGAAIFPGSKIHALSHVQWCVRQPEKSIVGYFRHRV